jgi:hypothetical protein
MPIINSIRPKPQSIAMMCNGCMKDHNKLAWFGMTPLNQGMYCRKCWQQRFDLLSEEKKQEWSFYKRRKNDNR